ncbi:MAG: CPBP family intramembrane metalloprotease [Eubacterium sp.]|nr:CPBP family intramembrane metalloprotease [Eubacterium sp.]
MSGLFFALLHFSFGSVLYDFFFGLLFAVIRIATDNLIYTMIMHCLFNLINVLLYYMRLGEVPGTVIVIVFTMAIMLFITLIIRFFRKNKIDIRVSRSEGKYKPWKLITKEGYITMAVCISVMGMLLAV